MGARSQKRESFLPVLRVESISKSFGGLQALNDVSFQVPPGAIHALIGPNGAGKTTLLNLITGAYPADSGRIVFGGRDLHGMKAYQRVEIGIARTFQNIEMFGSMSVLENVLVGRHVKTRCGFLGAMIRFPRIVREEREARERALDLLDFMGLADAVDSRSSDLPFGWQRFLEIARALATGPQILLLDEPASGLNAVETATLAELLKRIRHSGITLLLVEHDMNLVMDISDRIVVLNHGMTLAEGTPCEVQANDAVLSAYLGRERTGGTCSEFAS
ncbi:MAG: ABC transporter ATP-binding protein [Syntrophobacteraceae bacterium]